MLVHAHITGKDPLPFADDQKPKAKKSAKKPEPKQLEQIDGKDKND